MCADRLAYIMGTSACIMATTRDRVSSRASGVPIIQGWFRISGSTKAVSRLPVRRSIISSSRIPPMTRPSQRRTPRGMELSNFSSGASSARGEAWVRRRCLPATSTCCPRFLGNRSPYADPDARAVIAGLDLDIDIGSMERLFVAGLCGLAYGLAEVIEAFRSHGVESDMMVISGGAGRSPLVRQIMADTTGLTVAFPQTQEPVLLGAAMLGAVAGEVSRIDR